ncbi:MAG: Zn-ribbon domain-containing OB-fold protein [Gammaproteobacteria bacterium]|nr:Zn-ribbon domain-containing OB-fold protein [Gammaproteobacteria bacterium]
MNDLDLTKPHPIPTPETETFWQGLRDEQVLLQKCCSCGAWIFYPRSNCHKCLSSDLEWRQVSGEGTLYTFTIARQATSPHFVDEVPQLIAMIDLNEGVRLTSTMVTNDPEELTVGAKVVPVFDHVSDKVTLLRYRLG